MKSFGTKTKSYTMELLLALCLISFASVGMSDVIIDNGQSGTSSTGLWYLSGAAGYYGTDSLWARDGATYTWAMNSQPAGTYEVLMWWTAFPSRASAASTVITHAGGQQTLTINQQVNGGQWNSLGTYTFDGSGSVRITAANGETISTCADAVWFKTVSTSNIAPTAVIDSITPNPADAGQEIQFTGHGTDTDGTIAAYKWESDIDGDLSNGNSFSTSALSAGTHIISFTVQDNDGLWSIAATQNLTIDEALAEVIIDNGDAGTTSTGTWAVSGAPGAYGTNSIYAQTINATYTWRFTPTVSGTYTLSMWWTALESRSSSVPVNIQYNNGGIDNVVIDQRTNGGMWNEIGEYAFNAGSTYNITITAPTATPPSTCADAVKFTLLGSGNVPPVAVIDSISPNPAEYGEPIQFIGHGEDSDGTIAAYSWESSIDGYLTDTNSFFEDELSEGVHTIIFEVQDDDGEWSAPVQRTLTVGQPITEVIIDNGSPNCSYTGTWAVSGAPGAYGINSIYAQTINATYTWRFTPATTGAYKLAMWWTAMASRSTSVPVSIQHVGGTASATLNQTQNGGQWNEIGEYTFNAGTAYNVTITATVETPPSTCADAVKFTLATGNTPPVATIDSILPNPAEVNEMVEFRGHGTDTDGTIAAYEWQSDIDGVLSDANVFSTNTLSIGQHQITLRVQDDKGEWSQTVSQTLVIEAANIAPVAEILSITPNPATAGQTVSFSGKGTDSDGTIAAYSWESTIDGHLSDANAFSTSALSQGEHTIIFEVQDDDGAWSTEVLQTLTIGTPPTEVIIDNGSPECSYTGTWAASGAPNPYGAGSIYAQSINATYTWRFTPESSGTYKLSMWWTALSSRSTSVPVAIQHNGGTTSATLNQTQNGGQWNEIGEYLFDAGTAYNVTITATTETPPSTCADAVKFTQVTANNAPVATIDSILPNPAQEGQVVQFKGHGADTDGTITAYQWQSDIDGALSDANWFSTSSLSAGEHTITFRVQDNMGMWSQPMNETVTIQAAVNIPPTASITSITPNPATQGQTVSFVGSGNDTDGTIAAYKWESSIAGVIGSQASFNINTLAVGSHIITFTVQDDDGAWSAPASQTLVVQEPANVPPTASITSITPNPANTGQTVSFVGSGTDTDGTVTAYRWTSSINGVISSQASFNTNLLSPGTHTISFKVRDNKNEWSATVTRTLTINLSAANIISDNGSTGTSSTGTWQVSGGSNPYGTNSLYGNSGATYTWRFTPTISGNYQVYLWWTTVSSRSTSVPYAIQRNGGTTTVTVNQRLNGGKWNSAGTFAFTAGQTYTIRVTAPSGSYNACADAVRWALGSSSSAPTAQITAITPTPATLGEAVEFCGAGFDSDGTIAAYQWTSNINGALGSASTFTTSSLSAGTHTISLRVQDNSSNWSTTVNQQLVVTSTTNVPPTATITSITPNPASLGQSVNFSGAGTDTDGTVTAYSWSSSIDGALSTQSSFSKNNLSAGTHTISFRVQDNGGAWSQTVTRSLVINEGVADTIIDNGSANCTYTGSWDVSGASGYYGTNSVWSRNGTTYTWRFTPAVNGNYEVSAWWTQFETRSNNVPIDIYNAGGTNRVYVNQQANGGKWNSLGTFPFVGGVTYNITVTAAMGSTISTCADAVKLVYSGVITIPLPPNAQIISILPNPTMPNQATVLKGNATDGDGTVTAYRWRSSISGVLGTAKTLTTSALTAGTHTVYFSAQDNSGLWSPEVSATVDVGLEHIYIARCYGGNEQGGIPFDNVIQSLGGTQTGTDEWMYVNTSLNKTFYVHFIKNNAAVIQALARDGAHLILTTHSNYGLGPAFATATESANEYIESIRYVDDDRFLKIGTTAGCGVSAFGMRTGQAYPYWWPIYKDGKNAIMPYDFNDPNGSPPYNYYLTYQVPGEPNHYKVQTVHNAATQRFSDSGKPAWYSVTGETPDPNNPEHKKHFITNSAVWRPTIESSGTWIQYQDLPKNRDNSQYFKENYVYNAAGSGNDFTRFMFTIPLEGQYKVRAWWPGLATNATNAPFRVYHSSGSTLMTMNQTINGKQWNDLGTYTFTPGDYSVLLTDAVSSGNVVADGVQVGHINNPPDVVQSDFVAVSANFPLQIIPCGPAPLIVMLVNAGTGDLTGREWDCGDGTRNTTRDMLTHEYINPGVYTVSLTVKGPLGSSTKTKVGNVIVWPPESPVTIPLTAEFACYNKFSSTASPSAPFAAIFMEACRGTNITGWLWDFGDGQTSEEQNPIHIYTQPGNYAVKLTVRDSTGATHTETKPNYIRVVVFEKNIDNVDYPKGHYAGWAGKTLVKPKSVDITREQCKFNRMLLESCNSADYYIQTIGRGLMFYTVGASAGEGSLAYLRLYLQGRPDQEIWQAAQQVQAVYDYYNFNLPPEAGQQQSSSIMMSKAVSEPTALSLNAEQQADIDAMKSLSLLDTFEILGEPEYMTNQQLCNEAIAQAYSGSEYEAVELALARVKEPMEQTDESGIREMKTAKSIIAQFPDVSVPRLAGLYPQYDVSVNVNLITAAGALAGEKEILEMLLKALDDETLTIDTTPDLAGQPLRICDIAYNQLVLNLQIKDVLRTIGTGMTTDVRDYHIDVLKGKL